MNKLEGKKAGILCLKCGSVIISLYRRDCRHCECKTCFVDGGDEYMRSGGDFEFMQNVTIVPGKTLLEEVQERNNKLSKKTSRKKKND